MFDLSTYLLAVQTIDFVDPATFVVTVVLGAAAMLAFHHIGRVKGQGEGYVEGFDDGVGAADTRASYLDGFNDGLDASNERASYLDGLNDGLDVSDERGAYLDGFEDGVEVW